MIQLIFYLMWSTGWNEDGVSLALRVRVPDHAVLLVQPLPELAVQKHVLVVNRIRVRLQFLTFLKSNFVQEVPDLVCVARMVDVPDCAGDGSAVAQPLSRQNVAIGFFHRLHPFSNVLFAVAVLREADVDHDIAGVGHVDVKVGRPGVGIERVAVSDVHLRAQVRTNEKVWHARSQVQTAFSFGVIRQRNILHQIVESFRKIVREVVVRRPVLQLEQHRVALVVLHPLCQVVESIPEHFERNFWDDLVRLCVDDVVADVAELPAERVRRPEVHVQILRNVGHDHGLAANPLLLKRNKENTLKETQKY